MNKNIFLSLSALLLICLPTFSYSENEGALITQQFSNIQEFKMLTIVGSERNLQISEIKTIKRNIKINKELRKAMQRKSDYFISHQDENNKLIYSYGIGNPFLIHLQHLGYEDQISRVINDHAEIVIYYPSNINAASISLKKTINEKDVVMDRILIME